MGGCEPFFLERGTTGCLLIHGFCGSPPEMRLVGEHLAEKGITCLGVRLAGHGTTPEDFSKTTWKDWMASAEEGYKELEKKCKTVFVAGLSMGGAITLYLGAKYKPKGIICYSAAAGIFDWRVRLVPIGSRFIKFVPVPIEKNDLTDKSAIRYVKTYERLPLVCVLGLLDLMNNVKGAIPKVTVPALIMHGKKDKTLSIKNAHLIYSAIASSDKKLVLLENSGHAITVDSDKDKVFKETWEFITRLTRG